MLLIVETVVPHEDKETVVSIVRQQLEAPDVITEMQKETVLTMVILVPYVVCQQRRNLWDRSPLYLSWTCLFTCHCDTVLLIY
jgi:hypothetical protein